MKQDESTIHHEIGDFTIGQLANDYVAVQLQYMV
jgi:hypothetical protein